MDKKNILEMSLLQMHVVSFCNVTRNVNDLKPVKICEFPVLYFFFDKMVLLL